jgi:hypothetical protein
MFIKSFKNLDGFGAKISMRLHGDEDGKKLIGAIISILMLAGSLVLSLPTYIYRLCHIYKPFSNINNHLWYKKFNFQLF